MKHYSLLIIDDGLVRENRQIVYNQVLGSNFDLHFIETGHDLTKINQLNVHGYILDMVLEGWVGPNLNDQRDVFSQAIDLIGNKGPVFLVSSRWSPEVVSWLNNSKDKVKVEHFFEWREFKDLAKRIEEEPNPDFLIPVTLNIEKDLNKYYKRDLTKKRPNEQIVILQLSDLQFGDKLTDEDSGLLQHNIPQFLKEIGIMVDFVAITGDVSYEGLPKEYNLAKEWIQALCSNIFTFENYKPRLLLIPGNHDINLRLSSADNYKFKFKKGDTEGNKLIEIDSSEKQHHFYGSLPYREFAYSLTLDPTWLTNQPHLCFSNDRFLHWGIRFIHLNSVVDQCPAIPDLSSISVKYLDSVLASVSKLEVDKNIYTIILSHHGPEDFKPNPTNSSDRWPDIRAFIEGSHTNMFLYGHHHGFKTFVDEDEMGSTVCKTKFHRTSTLLLNSLVREKEHRRGFSIITLPRKDNSVIASECSIRKFEMRGSGFSEIT